MKIQVAALALFLPALACSKTEEPGAASSPANTAAAASSSAAPMMTAPSMTATAAAATSPTAGAHDLGWDVPAKWQTVASPSPMRKATYKIPKAAGDSDDPEVSVTQAGGAVDANIDRWAGQFGGTKDVKRTKTKVGAFDATIVEMKGTFAGSGMPGAPAAGPKDHWALLGAIIEGVDPPYFFKVTGPEKSVTAARGDFDKLVGSVRAK